MALRCWRRWLQDTTVLWCINTNLELLIKRWSHKRLLLRGTVGLVQCPMFVGPVLVSVSSCVFAGEGACISGVSRTLHRSCRGLARNHWWYHPRGYLLVGVPSNISRARWCFVRVRRRTGVSVCPSLWLRTLSRADVRDPHSRVDGDGSRRFACSRRVRRILMCH